MATFTFFDEFKRYMYGASTPDMDLVNDTLKLYLSNELPVVATDSVKTDVANITEQNGYTERTVVQSLVETAGGSGIWVLRNDAETEVWTASGGSFGPFQYVVMYDDTLTTPLDMLIGYWDHGSVVTVLTGNSYTVDLNATFDFFNLDG